MKYRFIILVYFIFTKASFCQQLTFNKLYPGYVNDLFIPSLEIMQTADKGYMLGNRGRLMKTDSLGQLQWMDSVRASFYSIDKTHDGGYVSTGWTRILKLDSNYLVNWYKNIIGIGNLLAYTIRETDDNGFLIGGETSMFSQYSTFIIKIDSVGTVNWAKLYKIPSGIAFNFMSLTNDGGFIFSGSSPTILGGGVSDLVIIKADSSGSPLWGKRYAVQNATAFFNHITATSDGGFVIAGYGNHNLYLLKIDSIGNKQWRKAYNSGIYCLARWVEETTDHGLIAAGDLEFGNYGYACFLLKTDSAGNMLWARELGGTAEVWTESVKQTSDGGFVIGCLNRDPNTDFLTIIKTDSLGHTGGCLEWNPVVTVANLNDSVVTETVIDSSITVTTASLTFTPTLIGSELALCPVGIQQIEANENEFLVYPNPFSNLLKVTMKNNLSTSIILYDIFSRKLLQQTFTNATSISTEQLAEGIYFYEVKNKNGVIKKGKVVKD